MYYSILLAELSPFIDDLSLGREITEHASSANCGSPHHRRIPRWCPRLAREQGFSRNCN
jgi:hypothetical protein